jgi:hypothetical protein
MQIRSTYPLALLLFLTLGLSGCGSVDNVEPISTPKPLSSAEARAMKCFEIDKQAEEISNRGSALVKEARALQLIWITEKMQEFLDTNKITREEFQTFSDAVTPGNLEPRMPGGELETLMKKLVNRGYLNGYLPSNVIEVGEKAALSSGESAKFKLEHKECYSDFENELTESLAKLKIKSAWAQRVENPVDLVP